MATAPALLADDGGVCDMLGTNTGWLVSHSDNDVWTSVVDVSLEFVCEEAAAAKYQFSLTPKGCVGRRQAQW